MPSRPIALIIPSLFSELSGPALPNIIDKLKHADYIHWIIVSLDGANQEEFEHAKKFFSILPQQLRIIWNDSEKMQYIMRVLEESNITIGPQGKGRGRG